MGYPPELKVLIGKVEATRTRRIAEARRGKHYPRLSPEESERLLRQFHPDYKADAKRRLKVGANKGELVPNEVADILEAESRVDPEEFAPGKVDRRADVLIIGAGGAGAAAALAANENGTNVLVVTKLRHGDANTMMAEGGIQAADRPNDSPMIHFLDTMGGGHFDNEAELVRVLVEDAPGALLWLEKLGVIFDKEKNGAMIGLHGGGTSRKRIHSAGDMTGAEIMRTLRDEVRNQGIEVIEFAPAVELLLDEKGRCGGAIIFNLETEEYLVVKAKATIIATGGFGRLHLQDFVTTNHYGATADGLVIAYRAGCSLRFMDSSQFHPTGVVFPEQNVGLLITEKVRGAGAQLVNVDGEQFCYPLEPRDAESAAIIRECVSKNKGVKTPTGRVGVWLDSPMIEIFQGEGEVQRRFPAKYKQFMRHDIDISREPMLVYPTLHYQNGGIRINPRAETEIPGLYAAGEVTGGIHGRNRLMGNSLLDVVVFGLRAGRTAAEGIKNIRVGRPDLGHVRRFRREQRTAGLRSERRSPILLPDYTGRIG